MIDPLPMAPTTVSPSDTAPMESAGQGAPAEDTGDIDITQMLDERMNEIPDNQKDFILQYLTPETVGVLGIILGKEAVDYFAPFTDPSKMLQVVPRPQGEAPSPAPQGPQAGPMGASPQANTAAPSSMPNMMAPQA